MSDKKLTECPYGEKCYRKNPIHFREYSHAHLSQIYDKGPDAINEEYDIPQHLSKELIMIQLKLLELIFPKPKNSNNSKSVASAKRSKSPQPSTSTTDADSNNSKNGATTKRSKSPQPSTSTTVDNSRLGKKRKITHDIHKYIEVVVEKGQMARKLARSAPYHMFLTAIEAQKDTHNEPLSITMQEIFDESLGEIESSVQINFMVDIGWLLAHYYFAGIIDSPLLVLYGDEMPELKTISQRYPNVTTFKVQMPTPFATSHSKIMMFAYKDGSMRVVISTANLYEDDWKNRTQGIWVGPKCERLPEHADSTDGESATNFRQDLMLYLVEYKCPKLQPWIARIRKCDFSAVNVFFVGSVPGGFRESNRGPPWGHPRLGYLLQKHCTAIDPKIPVVCQSSSIGSLGANVQAWIQHDFLNSMRKTEKATGLQQIPPFKMIYPSFGNVSGSHDGMLGGGCLPYSRNTNDKQPWLRSHLHHWCAKLRHRSQAMPHIKCYTRFNLDDQTVYWFCLTSANLSKAAWGSFNKNTQIQPCLRVANYEAGVLFLPKFVTGETTFPLGVTRDGVPPFPLPYDVPLTPYGPDDKPFLMDYLQA